MSAIDQVLRLLRPETSDKSQVSGLKGLSLEKAFFSGASETPLSQEEMPEREKTQKGKKKKKASKKDRKGTKQGSLKGSPNPSAGLAIMGSNQSTPILP